MPPAVINVVLALCGATLATYFSSIALRKGKISIADIANASLAGGVISTFGFAVIQNKLQGRLKCIDNCGVLNLHGLPGLMGGFAAILVINGINTSIQLKGIGVSIIIALAAGYIAGRILSLFGRKTEVYVDADEFADAEA